MCFYGRIWHAGHAALMEAILFDQVQVVKTMMEHYWFNEEELNESFLFACDSNTTSAHMVRLFLSNPRIDPNSVQAGDTCLVLATRENRLDIVRVLLDDARVDPTIDDYMAVEVASLRGHKAILRALVQDKRMDPVTCANIARLGGHLQMAEALMKTCSTKHHMTQSFPCPHLSDLMGRRRTI